MLIATLLLALGPPATSAGQAVTELPGLSVEDLSSWRDALRPAPGELGWDAIPWLATFADGVRAAESAQKPLLFWAMNGHPLGCT